MAIQFMDDFTGYGTDSANNTARMLNGPYAEISRFSLTTDPDPSGTGAQVLLGFGGGTGGVCRRILSAPQTTVGSAARYWLGALPNTNTDTPPGLMTFRDVNNNIHLRIWVNPSGYIDVYRRDSSGYVLIGSSNAPVVVTNAWRHIEIKAFFDATAGSVQIKLEGTTVVNITGVRTTTNVTGAVATCSGIAFISNQTAQVNMYIKDWIVWDDTTAVNNSFIGTCQVYKIVPDGDVSLGWTPNTGTTGFNLINDTTPDDDTGYIAAGSVGLASEFTLTDLPANVTAVKGVMTVNRSKKVDGGDGNLQVSVISGASTGTGANRAITTAYTYWFDVFDQDPSGSNWSRTLVNALHLKLNRTV